MFRALGKVVPDAMFDADAVALMDDARAAGLPVGILTNHAYMILGREWFASRPEFAGLATFIDAAEIGCPKPDPQAYLTAAERARRAARRGRLPRRHAGVRRRRPGRRDARPSWSTRSTGARRSTRRADCSGLRVTERVVVTGANRGLGLELARVYAERGDEVWAGCRRPAEADELGQLTDHVHELDVGSESHRSSGSPRPSVTRRSTC